VEAAEAGDEDDAPEEHDEGDAGQPFEFPPHHGGNDRRITGPRQGNEAVRVESCHGGDELGGIIAINAAGPVPNGARREEAAGQNKDPGERGEREEELFWGTHWRTT